MVTIIVNGVQREIQSPADTPLLYVLRNDLELSGPQFGCGLAQCGSCSVLLDGKEDPLVHNAPFGCLRQGGGNAGRPARSMGTAEGPVQG
jgi:xanthine dehydrogenase iron-sulfur cluster and FAD-binding subunit A